MRTRTRPRRTTMTSCFSATLMRSRSRSMSPRCSSSGGRPNGGREGWRKMRMRRLIGRGGLPSRGMWSSTTTGTRTRAVRPPCEEGPSRLRRLWRLCCWRTRRRTRSSLSSSSRRRRPPHGGRGTITSSTSSSSRSRKTPRPPLKRFQVKASPYLFSPWTGSACPMQIASWSCRTPLRQGTASWRRASTSTWGCGTGSSPSAARVRSWTRPGAAKASSRVWPAERSPMAT
mmetsp:Transcript_41975/g.105522  ORF Transcript_41975/g.105522 Transcript_41975/m.105522 type:complete len:230 (+) Transcript_41975:55-744(+)